MMTAEELDAEKNKFDAAVDAFVTRCTQDHTPILREEGLALHNSLQGAFGAYAEALRERGSSIESKEVAEAFFVRAGELSHTAFYRLLTSLLGYHSRHLSR